MKQHTGHVDLYIFISVLALMLFSVGAVYSASSYRSADKHDNDPDYLFKKHAVSIVFGVGALFAGMFIDYHKYKKTSKYILILGIGFLVLALLLGSATKGAQRWISFGDRSFQPTEFAKCALIIHLAVLISQKQKYIHDFKSGYVPLMIWVMMVCGLIFLQPNYSNAVIIFILSMIMMFVGRVSWKHIAGTFVVSLPIILTIILSSRHSLLRIDAFLNSGNSAAFTKSRHQIEQSLIALGNGGLFGLGVGMSKQKELFLPESYGDFIFAIIGEEYGYIGVIIILLIFVLILIRGMKIAKRAIDDLGRFLAVGITCTIVLYALINAAVTCGLAPTTGLPMPLLSYGGTAIVFTAYSLGILLNISMFTRIRPRENIPSATAPVPPVHQFYK